MFYMRNKHLRMGWKASSTSHTPVILNLPAETSAPDPQKRHILSEETPQGSKRPTRPPEKTLSLPTLKNFQTACTDHAIIWKTSREQPFCLPNESAEEYGVLPSGTYCNFSWKHFVKSQPYIVAPEYETTGPSNHTKQLCPPRKVTCCSHVSFYF